MNHPHGSSGVTGAYTQSPQIGIAGCTGLPMSGSIPHAVSLRAIYCDQQKHRMYRAIRESCPCFRLRTYRGHVETKGREGMMEYNKVVYFVNADGLARRISELFEKLDEL